jgi:subtilase family serine protease
VIRRLSVFLLTVVALVSGLNVLCQAQSQTLLTSHVREATLNGKAPLVGQLPATQTMHFDIVMALSHPAELKSFLQEVYDPSSPSYRHFVTVPEFTERFGPSQKDYDAVIRFAKANGFKVTHASRDAFDIQLKGTVANVEKAFHVSLGVYQHPSENRTFFAPDREPTVNLPFQLWHITGLDNYSIPRPALVRRPESQAKSQATTGSCPDQSFCGSDMRAAYYGNGPLNGAGQNLGLLEYAGYDIVDVNTYYQGANQTLNVPIVGISTDGTPILCTEAGGCDDTEQTLDITQAAGMAPNLTTIYVYVGSSDTAILGAMSSDTPLPAQLSASWTWSPSPGADDPYFQKMAAQGQTYLTASGDGGFYEGSALWPANSAYAVTVGGTDLETTGAGGAWASETAWVDGGGGWGNNVDIPSWQQLPGVITAANKGSTTFRDVPDISANANFTFYVCADQSGLAGCTANDYGGTSFATPMWAGYIALANQQGAANGVPQVGFINPAVYNIGIGSGYDNDFHDIVSGSNGLPTTVGYDLATGWGSPNGANLINALTGPEGPGFSLASSPGSVGLAQGGTATSTITITDGGGFSGSVTLSASGLPSGVTAAFSPNPATSTSTLTLTATGSAATGTFPVTISGTSGSLTGETSLSVTVNPLATGVSISPTSLAFATTVVGATSAAKNVTLTNGGSVTLDIAGLTTSANFGTTTATGKTPCGATLAAGKSCQIGVTFTPTQAGALTGTLSVSDNASNSPQTVTLSGKGEAQAAITPATGTFPATTVGTTSAAKPFTLHNYQSVILKNLAISTTGNFSVSSTTCQAQLTSSATCTINVVFTPTATGTATGTLSVSDNATNSPQTSSLTGTGKAPKN